VVGECKNTEQLIKPNYTHIHIHGHVFEVHVSCKTKLLFCICSIAHDDRDQNWDNLKLDHTVDIIQTTLHSVGNRDGKS